MRARDQNTASGSIAICIRTGAGLLGMIPLLGEGSRESGDPAVREFLVKTSHRPRPLPSGRWVMTQRWNDLLFAHWPFPPQVVAPLIPDGLQVDTFTCSSWLVVVPF